MNNKRPIDPRRKRKKEGEKQSRKIITGVVALLKKKKNLALKTMGGEKKKKRERENVGVKFSWRDVPEFNAFVPHPRPGILVPSVKTESTLELAVHAVLIPVHHNWFGFLLRSHHLLVLLMWLVSLVPIFELENLWNHAYPPANTRSQREMDEEWKKFPFVWKTFFFVPVRPSSSTWRPSFNTSSRYFSSSSKKLLLSFCCLHSVSYLMLGRAMSPRNPPEMEQRKRKNKKSKEKRARKLHLGEKLKLLTLSIRRDNLCRNIVRRRKMLFNLHNS